MDKIGPAAGRIGLFIALAAAWVGQTLAATAGVFQFVAGDVRVILDAGSERPAAKGSPVGVGDTISTARASTAQIKMGDGAIVVVQPESRLTVAEFRYNDREDGTEKMVFRLEQGGFRSVTGAIGHVNKGSYLIETPIAHIGVRGTDHESYYFPAPRSGNGEPAQAGVYNKVNVGLTYIRTQSGEVVIGPSQVGYAASAQDAPQLLTTMPGFFNRAVEPRSVRRASPPLAAGERRPPPSQVLQPVMTRDNVNLNDPTFRPSVVAYTAPPATEAAASFGHSGAGLGASPRGATLVNAGGDPAFGVNWGSWQGGLATVDGNATNGSTHFADSANLTSPAQLASLGSASVSATYSYAGGPAPTNNAGTQGTVNSLSVGVNFSAQTITSYNVNATVGATNWNASGSGAVSQFTGSSGIGLSGTCTGCTPAVPGVPGATASGTAHGAFVGSEAQRMITSFGLNSAGQAISGVGYLSRP